MLLLFRSSLLSPFKKNWKLEIELAPHPHFQLSILEILLVEQLLLNSGVAEED